MAETATRSDRPARDPVRRLLPTPIEEFLATESASGIILIFAAVIAFGWANSPWAEAYQGMRHATTGIQLGGFELKKPLELWVNDLLMAVFFFLVGLEIKRELMVGELAGVSRASLPVAGALGGMVVPALIYVACTKGTALVGGWGVPMATDIAFAVGVLALLGKRVPTALKVFLLALAIVDDLGAVIVIALFYTAQIDATSLILSLACVLVAAAYGWGGGVRTAVYVVLGALAWYFMLKSGVHATIAGVLMALTVPLKHGLSATDLKRELEQTLAQGSFEKVQAEMGHLEGVLERGQSALHRFEHALQPWVAFAIMPVFALFNAGVPLTGGGPEPLLSAASTGAFLGLLLGKPIGIIGFVWLATLLRLTRLPAGINWGAMAGVGFLAGIGFTMALFIANLAFGEGAALDQAKLGVLAASVVAALAGLVLLGMTLPRVPREG